MSVDWYEVLKAARRVGAGERKEGGKRLLEAVPFTVAQLVAETKIKRTERSTAEDIVAAWIGKFVRWGYVRTTERRSPEGGGRRVMFYELTRWGLRFKPGAAKEKRRPGRVAANPEDE